MMRMYDVMGVMKALAIVLVASTAHASPRVEIGAGTAVPLAVGVEATAHVTSRFALDVGIGILPSPYVDVINAAVVAFDGYDENTAELIAAALDDAIVAHVAVAYRPGRVPLTFHAGYTIAALGGGLGAASAIEAATGQDVRADVGNEIPMQSTVHFVRLGAAWRFDVHDRIVLRASLEYLHAVASASSIDAERRTTSGREGVDRASAALDAYLDDVYTSYVRAPVIGISGRYTW